MVRSLWIAAVVVGLAWTGLAGAQPSGAKAPGERYVIVRDDGGAPQRCKVLKTWRESNGAMAYQVQAVQTGELMTIVEIPSGPAGTAGQHEVSTRIFHWGQDGKPPAGTPMPPGSASVPSAPVTQSAPKPSTPVVTPWPSAAPAVPPKTVQAPTIVTPSKLAQAPVTASKSASTSMSTATEVPLPQPSSLYVQAQPVKPSPTVITLPASTAQSKPATTTSSGMPTIIQGPSGTAEVHNSVPQPRLVPTPSATSGCPTPCNNCCQPCCTCCPTTQPRQSLIGRIFKPNPPPTAIVSAPASSKPAAPATSVVQVATEPAKPRDWRESWGKVEPWKSTEQAKVEKPANPPAKRVARAPIQADPPRQPDPLKDPDWYRDMALKDKVPAKTTVVTATPSSPRKDEKSAVARITPVPMPATSPAPPARPAEVMAVPPVIQTRKGETPAGAKSAPVPMPEMSPAPPAGPHEEVVTVPPPTNPHGGVVELPADESNAFWTSPNAEAKAEKSPRHNAFDRHDGDMPPEGGPPAMAGAPMGPMPMNGPPMGPMPMPMPPRPPAPPAMPESGVPSGMGNAFTIAGSRRPLPSEFGLPQHDGNAFGDGTPNLVAQGPAVPPRPTMLPPAPGMVGSLPPPMPGMPAMAPPGPMAAVNPLMAVPPSPVKPAVPAVAAASEGVPQALVTLRDSLYPSQREMAAEHLGELNAHGQPQVVQSLMRAARADPAPSVRAACVRALGHMKANSAEVIAFVRDLKNDRDPRIRAEAEEALHALGVAVTPRQDSGLRPVSHP
jgi:hypothetical protein